MRRLAVLSSKGQLVVPSDIRRRLGWHPGTTLVLHYSAGSSRVVLGPLVRSQKGGSLPEPGCMREVYPPSAQYVEDLRQESERKA
jgi:AbrB family looped-hinge helix DNA binding protein